METVLGTQHVRVTVNGVAVPLRDIAFRSVGFEETAATHIDRPAPPVGLVAGQAVSAQAALAVPAFRFSPRVAVKRAIAYQVLTELAARAAQRHGHVVSLSAARAFAHQEYAVGQSHPVTLRRALPAPAFFTAGAVAAYRQTLTLNKELSVIAGPPGDGSRTPALRRWMIRQLQSTTVVIDGVPGLTAGNLAASLPPNL